MPPAPAGTWIKTCWPRSAPILLAKTRANRSAAPPAAKVTTSFTGRAGNVSAPATAVHNSARPNAAISPRLMVLLPGVSRPVPPQRRNNRSGAGQQTLVRHPATRQYDCSAEVAARGKRPAGFAGGMWGVCMKTILVPTEHNAAMASALDTALLLAQKFGSCIEGFPLRPAVADLVAMDPDSGLTMVAVKENDAEMVRQAEMLFRAFMESRHLSQRIGEGQTSLSWSWLTDSPSGHDFVGSYGRVFDMIVLARPGDEWQSPSMITLESAFFESGRPVLISPPASPRSLGTNILVAWNNSTEQARTMADAT